MTAGFAECRQARWHAAGRADYLWERVAAAGEVDMSSHRVVCTRQEPVTQPTSHAHIVAVGTGNDPDQETLSWALTEVIRAIEATGDTFYTVGLSTGRRARVLVVPCGYCGEKIIRSAPDHVYDNNLDSLRRCFG
jgi:hypothetical protein